MENPYIMSFMTQIGIMFTALCGLIGIIVQARNTSKNKKRDDIISVMDKKLDSLKEDSDKRDKELWDSVTEHHLRYFKDQLVATMSRIENGYKPTTEEKHILHEQKAKYNELGGDSYVDEMWNKLVSKDLI